MLGRKSGWEEEEKKKTPKNFLLTLSICRQSEHWVRNLFRRDRTFRPGPYPHHAHPARSHLFADPSSSWPGLQLYWAGRLWVRRKALLPPPPAPRSPRERWIILVFEHGRFPPDDIMGAEWVPAPRGGRRRGGGGEEGRGLGSRARAGCTSASWGGALRPLLTKDGRMPAPRDARCAPPGCSLSDFALRRWVIAKIIQSALLRARTLLGSPSRAPVSLTPSGAWHHTRLGAQAAGAFARWVRGGAEAPGWGSWWVLGPNSRAAGSPAGAARVAEAAPAGCLGVVASAGPPSPAQRASLFWLLPSARRAVYTSFILVREPHPSESAESRTATLQAHQPPVWAWGGRAPITRGGRTPRTTEGNLCLGGSANALKTESGSPQLSSRIPVPGTRPPGRGMPLCFCCRRDWELGLKTPEVSCAHGECRSYPGAGLASWAPGNEVTSWGRKTPKFFPQVVWVKEQT